MKNLKKMFLGATALMLASVSASHAAVDPLITTALSDAGTDSASIAGAVLLILVGIAAFRYIRKAL